jgi:hypothetical protein
MSIKRRRAQIQAARQSAAEIESAKRACAWCSMPFSNTLGDLKTVRPCIRLCAYKRHRREVERLFKSIRGQYQGASTTFVPRDGNPLADNGRAGSKCGERSPYGVDYGLNFLGVSFCSYQTRNIWCKLTGWGIGTAESANFLSIEGVT